MSYHFRFVISQILIVLFYWPLLRTALLLEKLGQPFQNSPLFWCQNKAIYFLCTDALNRFSTRLEHRFTQAQTEDMLKVVVSHRICFSDSAAFWCFSAIKK